MSVEKCKTGFRPWRMEDAPRLAALANDPDIGLNLRDGFPYPYTVKDAESYIAGCLETPGPVVCAITHCGDVAGSIGSFPGQNVHRVSAEIGYWLGKEYWGKGITAQAVKAFSEFIFATTGIIHLHAGIFSTNPASARVLEKAGYSLVGTMHDCALKNGIVIDLTYYELRKP